MPQLRRFKKLLIILQYLARVYDIKVLQGTWTYQVFYHFQ